MTKQTILLVILAMTAAGCATTQSQTLTTQLQMRVGELERNLSAKDDEIGQLKDQVKNLSYDVDHLKTQTKRQPVVAVESSSKSTASDGDIIRVSATVEQVQTALKKAGYYQGNIDGKLGSGTKAAISKFQADHSLKADGILGAKTWEELKANQE